MVFLNGFVDCPALRATENYLYALVQEVHGFLKLIVDAGFERSAIEGYRSNISRVLIFTLRGREMGSRVRAPSF